MTEILLKLLGARVESAGEVAGVRLALQGGVSGFWFIFFLIALFGLAWWSYQRNPVNITPRRKWTLFGLRCAFLLLLTILLLRPVLAFTVEGSIRRALLLLFDGSGSMAIKDPRVHSVDIQRAAIAGGQLDPTSTTNDLPQVANAPMQSSSRFEIAQAVLQSTNLNLLPQLDDEFDLVPFSYGQSLVSLPRPTGTNENVEIQKQPTPEFFPGSPA